MWELFEVEKKFSFSSSRRSNESVHNKPWPKSQEILFARRNNESNWWILECLGTGSYWECCLYFVAKRSHFFYLPRLASNRRAVNRQQLHFNQAGCLCGRCLSDWNRIVSETVKRDWTFYCFNSQTVDSARLRAKCLQTLSIHRANNGSSNIARHSSALNNLLRSIFISHNLCRHPNLFALSSCTSRGTSDIHKYFMFSGKALGTWDR